MSPAPNLSHATALAGAVPGDHLAEAVLDDNGNVLVGAGCELTASLIQSLTRRGVTGLCVARAVAAEAVDAVDPAVRHERVLARIAHLFRHATQQERLNPLMHSVLRHRLESAP
jgi:hypothetical protein